MMKRDEAARAVWPRVLGYFLGAMLLLTLLSRAADSMLLPQVKCERPFPGALKHVVALSGVIEAREQWPVMAEPELPVARVYVRAGQSVKAGETLLLYDAQALQRKLDAKQAALKKLMLQAQLDAMPEPTPEPSKPPKPDATPAPQAQQADNGKTALKQQLSRLDIELGQREVEHLLQLLYGGAALAAPVDGVISEVLSKPGDAISGAALRLSPTSSGLVVRAAVAEEQVKHLKPGMEARFQRSGEARANVADAVLSELSPTATGYEASFQLPDGAGTIGQSVSITASQNTETYQMRVPLGAIVEVGGTKGVYRVRTGQSVLGDMEYVEFVAAQLIETDAQYAAISASLSDRDQVIVSSSKPIGAGDRVRSLS